jgi:hypothetical protein
MKIHSLKLIFLAVVFVTLAAPHLPAQDWVHTGTNLGNDRIRIAAADFKPGSVDPQTPALKATFDATLYGDLSNAGIFDLVSKSLAPQATPGLPQEINLGSMVQCAHQRRHGCLRFSGREQRPHRCLWLAFRYAQRHQPPGARQSNTTKLQARIRRAPSPIASPMKSSCASAAASTASAKPKFISSAPAPAPRKSGRWITTGRISTPSPTSAPSPSPRASHRITPVSHLHPWVARVGIFACTPLSSTAWSRSRPASPAAATSPRHGRRMAPKSHSPRRALAIRKSG